MSSNIIQYTQRACPIITCPMASFRKGCRCRGECMWQPTRPPATHTNILLGCMPNCSLCHSCSLPSSLVPLHPSLFSPSYVYFSFASILSILPPYCGLSVSGSALHPRHHHQYTIILHSQIGSFNS